MDYIIYKIYGLQFKEGVSRGMFRMIKRKNEKIYNIYRRKHERKIKFARNE